METIIQNHSQMIGTYDSEELEVLSTVEEITLVEGLEATKVADRKFFANGEVLYTITVLNETTEDYETPIFTDELNALLTLVDGSFKVDGNDYTYTFDANTITATLPTIAAGGSLEVTFLVRKA